MDERRPANLADRLVVGPVYELQADGVTLVPAPPWICVEHGVERCEPCSKPRFFTEEEVQRWMS